MLSRTLSQTFRVTVALVLSLVSSGLPSTLAYAQQPADAGQETCPTTPAFSDSTGGWVKYDGLSDTTFSVPQKTDFSVTQICYKSSTTVVNPAPLGTMVTSTVRNKPIDQPGSSIQNLSHVSAYYTPVVYDECPLLAGNQPAGTSCAKQGDKETQALPGVLDCTARTFTIQNQERTRSYTFDSSSNMWVAENWSAWTNTTQTVMEATAQQCPPYDACPQLEGNQLVNTPCSMSDELEKRTLDGVVDCKKDTYTVEYQERTLSYTFDVRSNTWIAGEWSKWETVDTTVTEATDEQCPENKKIMICHATSAVKNAYNKIEVSVSAADGIAGNSGAQPDHYGEHTGAIFNPATDVNGGNWGDIIPPIPGVHSGLNWELGQAIYENGDCETPLPATPEQPEFKDFCGEMYDLLYIPDTEGVTYYVNGEKASEGWMQPYEAEVTVTAVAKKGYMLTADSTTSWTYEYTDENCLSITKTARVLSDTNGDGTIGVGDKVMWDITVTNNGSEWFEHFTVQVTDEGAVLENDGYIEHLAPGDSVTLEAHSFITAADISTVCKVTNTASFEATYSGFEIISLSLEDVVIEDPVYEADFMGTVNAEATFNCPTPGRGGDTPTPGQTLGTSTTSTPTLSEAVLPAVLPATGQSDSPFMIIVASLLAYGAAYFLQGRRKLASEIA